MSAGSKALSSKWSPARWRAVPALMLGALLLVSGVAPTTARTTAGSPRAGTPRRPRGRREEGRRSGGDHADPGGRCHRDRPAGADHDRGQRWQARRGQGRQRAERTGRRALDPDGKTGSPRSPSPSAARTRSPRPRPMPTTTPTTARATFGTLSGDKKVTDEVQPRGRRHRRRRLPVVADLRLPVRNRAAVEKALSVGRRAQGRGRLALVRQHPEWTTGRRTTGRPARA